MTVEAVFRSGHPRVLTEHRKLVDAVSNQNHYADLLEAEYGLDVLVSNSGHVGRVIVGFAPPSDTEPAPLGMKRDDRNIYVPDMRTSKGKELQAGFAEHAAPKPNYPGMPTSTFHTSHIFFPGSEQHGDHVYVMWGVGVERILGVDRSLWDHVPLAEWYLLKSAQQSNEQDHDNDNDE